METARARLAALLRAGRDALAQWPAGTALLAAAAVAATVVPALSRALIDLRGAEGDGAAPWRPLTGHLVHASASHLLLNLLVLVPAAALRERRVGAARLLVEYAVLAVAVAAGVRLLHDGWTSYCGLSGVLYGWLALVLLDLGGAGASRRDRPDRPRADRPRARALGLAVVALLAAKTALELAGSGWLAGREALEAALGVRYLAGSHAAGLAAGALLALAGRSGGRELLATRGATGP
ncbi:MAG: rhomboid family intramembrane serine protease [Planctomycetes bacterium]|nr:rhomboid family intramembrane serine protease [Planctomycetota bacterium]